MEDKAKEPEILDNKEEAGGFNDTSEKQLQRFEERSPDYSAQQAEISKVETDLAKTVQTAIMQKYDIAKIEKLISIFTDQKKRIAEEAYHQAMANFRSKMPQLTKDKYNKHFDSYYTSLGNLLETYNPPLGRNGLSISFPTPQQDNKEITVECRVTHALGHHESVKLSAPIDTSPVGRDSGKKVRNPIQDIKSTFTYLRSATCEAVLGVSGTEASISDDGNLAGAATGNLITEDQAKKLEKLMIESKINVKLFLKSYDISGEKTEDIRKLQAKNFKKAESTLLAKKKNLPKSQPAKKAPAKKAAPKQKPEREPGMEG